MIKNFPVQKSVPHQSKGKFHYGIDSRVKFLGFHIIKFEFGEQLLFLSQKKSPVNSTCHTLKFVQNCQQDSVPPMVRWIVAF